ncbi:hypothetical protein ACFX50_03525 [Neisseria meningitidis]
MLIHYNAAHIKGQRGAPAFSGGQKIGPRKTRFAKYKPPVTPPV